MWLVRGDDPCSSNIDAQVSDVPPGIFDPASGLVCRPRHLLQLYDKVQSEPVKRAGYTVTKAGSRRERCFDMVEEG